uniref:Pentatricopeptide repeat-containing protein 1, mitochondrial-like isoform X2 n=2 Tax=Castor canadensis TaxID=51338 RepID=A0A8B7UDG7_CASCN|nr:pentatricopeptide repeat-containing protein 1, mitochondrial-like isoform X2 [Castor canadensis]
MDLMRLARLFSGPRPMGLSIHRYLDPHGARWTRDEQELAWLRAMWPARPGSLSFSSSSSQLPLGQRSQKNTSSLPCDLSQPGLPSSEKDEDEEHFGTLSDKYSSRRVFRKSTAQLYNLRLWQQSVDGDEGELEPRPWQGRRNTPYWYFFQCKRLIKAGKLAEALDLFERQMLKEEQLQPLECNYTVLIGGCGRVGYLKKAFRLYSDEIVHKGHAVTEETFNFLLMGCIQDKKTGFRHALQVWRQMLSLGLKPSRHGYNLLLGAARDCGLGDPEVASRLLLRPQEEMLLLQSPASRWRAGSRGQPRSGDGVSATLHVEVLERQLFLEPSQELEEPPEARLPTKAHINVGTEPKPGHTAALTPLAMKPPPLELDVNLLALGTVSPTVVSFGTVATPADRLALMGGLEGFLGKMVEHGLHPDIKTLTLLAEVVEPGSPAETSLLAALDRYQVEADVTFFNTLMRKKSKLGDLEGAKALLPVLAKRGIVPNLQTFCNLAIGCRSPRDGLQLLADMKKSQLNPNTHIYSTLINAAIKKLDYAYLIDILKDMLQSRVPVNEVVIRQLEFAAEYPPTFDRYKGKNTYLEKIDGFRAYYKQWLKVMPAEETPHPWQEFRTKPKGNRDTIGDAGVNGGHGSR